MISAKNFVRNYEKKLYLDYQPLGQRDYRTIDPATQCIILKIVGFLESVRFSYSVQWGHHEYK